MSGCESVPSHQLTETERLTDAYWLVAQIERNYAPLALKQERDHWSWLQLREEYLADVRADQTNEAFLLRSHRLVATLKDAHSSLLPSPGNLPGRAQVATLGFSGSRVGTTLWVQGFISLNLPALRNDPSTAASGHVGPGSESASAAPSEAHSGQPSSGRTGAVSPESRGSQAPEGPVRIGDRITHLDGLTLPEAIDQELLPLRNLGNAEANLTFHMNRLFHRISLFQPMPRQPNARIRGLRADGTPFECELPWIQKDFSEVANLISQAGIQFTDFQSRPLPPAPALGGQSPWRGNFGQLEIWNRLAGGASLPWLSSTSEPQAPPPPSSRLGPSPAGKSPPPGATPSTGLTLGPQAALSPWDRLQLERQIPAGAVPLTGIDSLAAYVTRERHGETRKRVATVRIPSFALEDLSLGHARELSREHVLGDFKRLLKQLQELEVELLVIDLINNSGGSVTLGLEMAQALSANRLPVISIQLVLNENWLDTFEQDSRNAATDRERELSARVFQTLRRARDQGARLSPPLGADVLLPDQLEPNSEIERGFKVAILVNELCGSTCDLFAAQLKGLPWVKVVGTQTLGAGGNVSDRVASPIARIGLRLTESLLLAPSGAPIENQGVPPDVPISVNEDTPNKFEGIRTRAVQALLEEWGNSR